MRITHLNRPKSIRRSIQTFLLTNVILTGAFLVATLYLDRMQEQAHTGFVKRSVLAGETFQILDRMDRLLAEYMRTWQDPFLEDFLVKSQDLEQLLASISILSTGEQQSLNYLRRMDAFNTYQRRLLQKPESVQARRYIILSYIRMALGDHKAQAYEFAHTDFTSNRLLYDRLLSRLSNLRVFLWGMFIFLFALVVSVFTRSLMHINKSMHRMDSTLRELTKKNWDAPDLPDNQYAEFSEVAVTINRMKHVIASHISRLLEHSRLERELNLEKLDNECKERMLVEAQMANLKAQINPHFLFNTLNIIGKSALLGSPEQVMELIEATAKILRYSLHAAQGHVAVKDEVDMAATYLYLQKSRFGDIITYDISVDDDVLECGIQSMLIQPLVENCFEHGFEGTKAFHVAIDVHKKEGKLEIIIFDNGKGFDRDNPDGAAPPGEGIGMNNIRRRLQLEYGKEASLNVESESGRGARVRMIMPGERSVDNENPYR